MTFRQSLVAAAGAQMRRTTFATVQARALGLGVRRRSRASSILPPPAQAPHPVARRDRTATKDDYDDCLVRRTSGSRGPALPARVRPCPIRRRVPHRRASSPTTGASPSPISSPGSPPPQSYSPRASPTRPLPGCRSRSGSTRRSRRWSSTRSSARRGFSASARRRRSRSSVRRALGRVVAGRRRDAARHRDRNAVAARRPHARRRVVPAPGLRRELHLRAGADRLQGRHRRS